MSTTKWSLDPAHSEVSFKVKHLMLTNISGQFTSFDASLETDGDHFENAKIEFSADATSIETGNTDRDNHLRSADFLEVEKFPKISFKATSFTGNDHLTGDLTLHGVTRPITLEAELGGIAKDPWGNTKTGITATGKINRKDFGLGWNAALEAGGVLVGEEVKLNVELQFVKQ